MKKVVILFLYIATLVFDGKQISSQQDEDVFINETFFIQPTKSLEELHSKINALLSNKNLNNFAISVFSLDKGNYYYEQNADRPLTPASLTKLFTTFNTIKTFGTNFKVKTQIFADGVIIKDTLRGDLIIKGGGDPLFSINDIESLADGVSKFGIKYITGNIIADSRVFDNKLNRIDYSGDRDIVEITPPISGLAIDKNTVTVVVNSGSNSSEKPRVQCYPSSDYFKIINNCSVSKSKGRRSRNNVKIKSKESGNGLQNIYVSGSIIPRTTYSYQYHINNPALAFAGTFINRFNSGKVKIAGTFKQAKEGTLIFYPNLVLITEFERDIWDIINITNKNSDNYLAESMFKLYSGHICRESNKDLESIKDSLSKKLYIHCEECKLNDGSGLSRRNLVTARSLTNLLIDVYKSDFKDNFINSLAIAGIDGTLRKRFRSNSTVSNIRAKTGTLRNASGLAGFVKTLEGENIAFAFIFNGNDVGYYKSLENQLAELLATFYIDYSKK